MMDWCYSFFGLLFIFFGHKGWCRKLLNFVLSHIRRVAPKMAQSLLSALTWCVVVSLVTMLLQIFSWFWQWKSFENRLIFDKVKGSTKTVPFLGHPVYKQEAELSLSVSTSSRSNINDTETTTDRRQTDECCQSLRNVILIKYVKVLYISSDCYLSILTSLILSTMTNALYLSRYDTRV